MPNKKKFGKKMKGGYRGTASSGIIDGPATPVASDAASRKKWNKRRRRAGNLGTPTIDNYNKWAREGLTINQITERESARRSNVGRNKAAGMSQRAAEEKAAEAYGGDAGGESGRARKGGSTYNKYADSIYLNGISAVGVVGFVWMMVSRSLIRHKYSEALSYGLMEAGVTFSLFLI